MKHKKSVIVLLIFSIILTFTFNLYSQDNEKLVKKAIRFKLQGRLDKALTLYEKIITNDREAVSINSEGLMDALIKKYEKMNKGKDAALLYKIADFCDLNGETDKAIKYFKMILPLKDKKLSKKARERIESLEKEKELYAKLIRENEKKEEKEQKSEDVNNTQTNDNQNYSQNNYATQEEETYPEDNVQKINELNEKISQLQKEVEEAQKIMEKNKRDRDGIGNVRVWRLKKSDIGKDKYNNTFARRYRQSRKAYNAKVEKLNKLKEELNSYKK